MAIILPFNFPPSPQIIEQAVDCVQAGGVLAVPTDSFYALAAGAFQPVALERLFPIKGDRSHKPFPVLIGDPSQLDQLVQHVPEIARKLMQQFWPGLLTLVLKAQAHLSSVLTSEHGTVGVRHMPTKPAVTRNSAVNSVAKEKKRTPSSSSIILRVRYVAFSLPRRKITQLNR